MKRLLARIVWQDEAQDLIEYGLLAAFISLVAIVAITNVGTSLQTAYNGIASRIP